MKLIQIPSQHIDDVWPLVRKRIVEASGRSNGRFDEASIQQELKVKRQQLWIVWDEEKQESRAVVVTQLLVYPTGMKVADVVIVIGEGRKDWKHLVTILEEWGRKEECGLMQLFARKGWARDMTDYKLSHVLLEKKL